MPLSSLSTVNTALGNIQQTAGQAPMPLDAIEARRVQRMKEEIAQQRADTETQKAEEYERAGQATRARDARTVAEKAQKDAYFAGGEPIDQTSQESLERTIGNRITRLLDSPHPDHVELGVKMKKEFKEKYSTLSAGGTLLKDGKPVYTAPSAPPSGPNLQKGNRYIVNGTVTASRFNPAPDKGYDELPDGKGGWRRVTPQDKLMTSSTNLEIGPDGQISFKTGLGDSTIATQSALEGEQIKGEELALEAKQLMRDITSDDVGVRGVFGEIIVDRLFGQVFDSLVNKDRVKNRQSMRAIREKGLRLMTTDSRFNLADREAVEKLFPSDGIFESQPNAKEKLAGFFDIINDRIDFSAGKLNRKSFVSMTVDEIVAAVKAGTLDKATAYRALTLFHGLNP